MKSSNFKLMRYLLLLLLPLLVLFGSITLPPVAAQAPVTPQGLSKLTVSPGETKQMPVIYIHGWNDESVR